MKIINITSKETYLCSLSSAEVRLITGGKFFYSDFKELLNNEIDIDLSKFNKLPAKYDLNDVENAVRSLESAIKFLNNKKESLEYINSIKVE
ncbi:hypothetical protein [Aliarcobacter butzleri]|jgi:hypothetical protein|uniref:hypothetical protein n=1 Tax=Aliarcobacter butzleri TaxID=28197 RepID=UPI0021B66B13|nr:hypothetical protein [Aliarcobacter butzleri]MCT7637037.1 hypothetical protein [Aliarcobacter butzleri]